jgi:hypothetical protein
LDEHLVETGLLPAHSFEVRHAKRTVPFADYFAVRDRLRAAEAARTRTAAATAIGDRSRERVYAEGAGCR